MTRPPCSCLVEQNRPGKIRDNEVKNAAFVARASRPRFCLIAENEKTRRRDAGATARHLSPANSCYSGAMPSSDRKSGTLAALWRALVEVGFIIFLFYSNLLMGEFTRSGGRGKTLAFAIHDIFTISNFEIAVVSGLIGYVVFEYLRKQV
jgi:hypothetical protein